MTPMAFARTRKRQFPRLKDALKKFGVTYGELLCWEMGLKRIPRAALAVVKYIPEPADNPRRGRAPRNLRFGISTPEVFYETVQSAADDNGLTYHDAYTRARIGRDGWRLVSLEETESAC